MASDEEQRIERGLAALAAGCTEDQFVEEARGIGSEAPEEAIRNAWRELRIRQREGARPAEQVADGE